jgi:HEAT repeat protein
MSASPEGVVMSRFTFVCQLLLLSPAFALDANIKELIEKLKSPTTPVRIEAVSELEKQGRAAKEAVPAMIELLRTAKLGSEEYSAVIHAIERIGVEKDLLPTLLGGIKGRNPNFADASWRLLSLMGMPALDGILEAAKDTQPATRFYALSALALMKEKPANQVLPVLISRLEDTEPVVRSQAAVALASMGAAAEPAVPALIKSLRAKNIGAALALERVGPAAKNAVPALRDALADTTTAITINMHSSSEAGKVSQVKVTLAEYAAGALGKLGEDAKPAVPNLLRALRSDVEGLRLKVIQALAELGPIDKAIVPGLSHALLNPAHKPEAQKAIFDAMGKMGDVAVPELVRILRNGAVRHRELAAIQLGQLGPLAAKAVPDLTFTLRNTSPAIRAASAKALGEIGEEAKSALPALKQMAMTDRDPKTQQAAGDAVTKITRD